MIHLAKGPVVADAMFVTVQKEVAERMTARSGSRDYGTLSIFLQATGDVEILRVLKPSVFWPPPGVDSALVRFVRDEPKSRQIEDMAILSDVVALFMGHRRKMLRACLKSVPSHLGDPDLWMGILERLAIDPTLRPGDLTPASTWTWPMPGGAATSNSESQRPAGTPSDSKYKTRLRSTMASANDMCDEVLDKLRSLGDPKAAAGAARFGIDAPDVWGVRAPDLRRLAKEIGRDHSLAAQLWRTGIHDARILAALIDDPVKVTPRQMERWAGDFNSWAVCDAAC